MGLLISIIWNYVSSLVSLLPVLFVPYAICFMLKKSAKDEADEEMKKKVAKNREFIKNLVLVSFFIVCVLIIVAALRQGVYSQLAVEEYIISVCVMLMGFGVLYFVMYLIRKVIETITEGIALYKKNGMPWNQPEESENPETYDWKVQEQHKQFLQTVADKERQAENDYAENTSSQQKVKQPVSRKVVVYGDEVYKPIAPPVTKQKRPKPIKKKKPEIVMPAETVEDTSIIGGFEPDEQSEPLSAEKTEVFTDVFETSSFDGMTTDFNTDVNTDWN